MTAGHHHTAGFYASDAEFRALIVPFVEEGTAAGEAVVLGYDERKSALLRTWLSEPDAVVFVGPGHYSTPARTIADYRRLFEHHLARGVTRIRIAGDVPHEGNGGRFAGWDRYEWAVNTVWSAYPVLSACLYDATLISPYVREVVERTHPLLLSPAGVIEANARYTQAHPTPVIAADPLESTPPLIDLTNPSPVQARRAVEQAARPHLPAQILDDLVFGASEAATNAIIHGRPPTSIRIWSTPGRVVVHVTDTGSGPRNPLAGLMPVVKEAGGLGLWLTHQLDIDVALITTPHGFTIRLRGGKLD
ncbi:MULTISPECIES: sensor histidine kinase [Actinokineospora]|uniref:Uncharacterized protein n=1 Tax=Actinokineospora fastidiosa TaxID=1816 RepID=A0A918GU72_9PSEU|nr:MULTISPECIES: sensor histidine kinase [Actinokineospora]UVS79291.1 hypothetical protein Actkin_03038 [Actinokineospora sp. UTMC 2448]GGS60216.1 hypothetical protein GCM10010171_63990 [Actinokineospora fastidiosa]